MVALGPLIEAWALLSTELLTALMPLLEPLIKLIGRLAAYLADDLARTISDVVVPAVETIAALLRGDFDGAVNAAKRAVSGFVSAAVARFTELPTRAAAALARLAVELRIKVDRAGVEMVQAMVRKRTELVNMVRQIPAMAGAALGQLGSYLYWKGVSLISGFIQGIRDSIPSVQGILGGLTASLPDWKGPEAVDRTILTPAGRSLIGGFQAGIADQLPALRDQLRGLTADLPGMALPGAPGAGMRGGVPAVGGQTVRVIVQPRGGVDKLAALLQEWIVVDSGGDVQASLGRG